METANADDVLCVGPGTYYGEITIQVPLTLLGTDGAEDTILDGRGDGRTLLIDSSPGTVVRGFTVTGGEIAEHGAGMLVKYSDDVLIEDMIFEDNVSKGDGYGGGLAIFESKFAQVTDSIFRDN